MGKKRLRSRKKSLEQVIREHHTFLSELKEECERFLRLLSRLEDENLFEDQREEILGEA